MLLTPVLSRQKTIAGPFILRSSSASLTTLRTLAYAVSSMLSLPPANAGGHLSIISCVRYAFVVAFLVMSQVVGGVKS